MLWATCVSCSPWTTSTIRSPGSADTARSSSTKWSSTKTCIGSATSEAPRAFSSGWPSKSADARHGGYVQFVDLIYGAGKLDRRVEDVEDLLREWRVREADWGQLYLEFKSATPP